MRWLVRPTSGIERFFLLNSELTRLFLSTERLENEVKGKAALDKDKKKVEAMYAEVKAKFEQEATARVNEEAARKKLQGEFQQVW